MIDVQKVINVFILSANVSCDWYHPGYLGLRPSFKDLTNPSNTRNINEEEEKPVVWSTKQLHPEAGETSLTQARA